MGKPDNYFYFQTFVYGEQVMGNSRSY